MHSLSTCEARSAVPGVLPAIRQPAIRQLLLGQQLGTGQSRLERSVPTRSACVHRCANKRISIDAKKPYRSVRGYQYYLTGSRCPPEMPGAKVQLILLDLRHDRSEERRVGKECRY